MTEAPEGVWIELDGDDILIHNNKPNLLELISTGLLLEYIRKDVSDALLKQAREEALREAAEPMDKPRVKPLAWKLDDNRTAYAQRRYFADRYCIEHRLYGDDAFDLWIGPDAVKATRHATLEAAKAAAQADYEARILAALEPVTVQEAARVLLDAMSDITAKPLAEMSDAMKIEAHPAILLRGLCAALRALAQKDAGNG